MKTEFADALLSENRNENLPGEIAETGNYHISVSGHQAKGNVSFTRISGEME